MKIVFICPYFGKLPNYFDLWLESCKYNKEIDWIIITDDKTQYSYPNNVKVIYKEFHEIKSLIQSKFSFEIALNNPYKLCDFKPAYGYIFEEYIREYDLWGHCDFDCIFGDIKFFINKHIIEMYEKILTLGHMSIYRNNYEVNRRFMLDTGKILNYRDIYSRHKNYAFDEWNLYGNINDIYEYNKFKYFNNEIYADIYPLSYNFKLSKYDINSCKYFIENSKQIFIWERGKVYRIFIKDNQLYKEEYAYIHFQKRKMMLDIDDIHNIEKFIIVPNKFFKINKDIQLKDIKKYSRNKIFYNQYFKLKYKNLKVKLYRIMKGTL